MKFLRKKEDGFVALFTVLLVSVILAMALGIASLSLKEIVLSSSASEGSKAFYAADSGIECGLYLERSTIGPINSFDCNGLSLPTSSSNDPDAEEVVEFDLPLGESGELCARVKIMREVTSGLGYSTAIDSKGSNMPCDDPDNPKRVERSIRVTY